MYRPYATTSRAFEPEFVSNPNAASRGAFRSDVPEATWARSGQRLHLAYARQEPYRADVREKVPTASTDAIFTAERRLSAETAQSLAHQAAVLKHLQANWDGYGAPPVQEAVVDSVLEDMSLALAGLECPPPDLIPGGDGSVQAEWHLEKIELTYNRAQNGTRFTWVHQRETGEEHEFYEPLAIEGLLKWAPRLA